MSLKIWLPLLGNLTNNGSYSCTITNNGATVNSAGKIGSCYSFDGSNDSIRITPSPFSNDTTEFSYACWMKPNASSSGCLFSDRTDTHSWGFSLFVNNSGNILFDAGKERQTKAYTFTTGTWYHIAFTYKKGDYKRIYINGEEIDSVATTGTMTTVCTTNAFIGGSQNGETTLNANYFNGCLNDVRIYDHCLSAAEVHEISQGLVLHYKLDSFQGGYGNPNLGNTSATYSNKINVITVNASGWGGDTGTVTFYHSGGYAGLPYKVYHKTSTGTGGIYNKTANDISLEANTTYTMSIWAKASRAFTGNSYGFCINRGSDNHYITYGQNVIFKTEWTFYSKTFTTSDSENGLYGEMSIIYDDAVTDYYIYYSGFKIEKGTVATPWCSPDASLNIIQDSSGYEYNGTILGSPIINSDTTRYTYSTNFPVNADGILSTYPVSLWNNAFTYSFWIKPSGENGARSVYAASYSGTSCSLEKTTGNKLRFYWYGSPDLKTTNLTIIDGSWQHIAVVKSEDKSNVYCYYNGVLKDTFTNTLSDKNFSGTLRIARDTRGDATSYNGLMSDFRIYATALSADDIKKLYEVRAKADNLHAMHAYEFIENQNATKLTKQGQFKCDEIVESTAAKIKNDRTLEATEFIEF